MQDYNTSVILNLYVTPEKPVVSYLTPLTGLALPFFSPGWSPTSIHPSHLDLAGKLT